MSKPKYPLVGADAIISAFGTVFWEAGWPDVEVQTASGSRYVLRSDRSISGGRLNLTGKLRGAVYRRGGPIMVGRVVEGCRMEIGCDDGRTAVTTDVVAVLRV